MIEDALTLTTGQFLKLLFKRVTSGFVEVCYLAPEEAKLYPRVITHFRPLPIGDVPDYPPAIADTNAEGYGVYFGVTVSGVAHPPETRISEKTGREYTFYPRRKEADVTLAPVLWADVDNVTPEEGYAQLISAPVPPSIVVRSGGGMHGYWLLNQPAVITPETKGDFKRALHGLALKVGGDVVARDMARIMRLPGTVNTKPGRNGALCEVLDCIPVFYDYAVLGRELRKFAPREAPRPSRSVPVSAVDARLPKMVTDFIQYGAPAGRRNHDLYVCACFYRDHGFSQMQAENDLGPAVTSNDFTHEEAMRTINSAYREAAQPALPRYMASRMAMGDKR
jgi:hypothetical protein